MKKKLPLFLSNVVFHFTGRHIIGNAAKPLLVGLAMLLSITSAFGQAPTLSYSAVTDTLAKTIAPITPVSNGVAVQAFNQTPSHLTATFSSYLYDISYVAADAAGNVYASQGGGTVVEVPVSGHTKVLGSGSLTTVTGIAVDASGKVYVTDSGDGTVKMVPQTGSATVIASGFGSPNGLAIDGAGNIYVSDGSNNVVVKIPAGGGTPVNIGSGYSTPRGVAVDAAGNVYVDDYYNAALKKIPPGSNTPVQIYTFGPGQTYFMVDAGGNAYVPNTSGIVTEVPADGGTPYTVITNASGGVGIAMDGYGNLIIGCPTQNIVDRYNPQGGYYTSQFFVPGLALNRNTGVVTGTPTTGSAATNYTIYGYNTSGGTAATLSMTIVTPLAIDSLKAAQDTLNSAATLNYTATFAGSVSGLGASDFSLTTSGVTGASVGTPSSADGGTTWTVPVNTGTGNGTIQLVLTNDVGISPGVSTTLPFAGNTYTIDKTPPELTTASYLSSNANTAWAKLGDTLTFSITFNKQVQTPTVTIGGIAVTPVNTSGNTWVSQLVLTSSNTEGNYGYVFSTHDLAGNPYYISSDQYNAYIVYDMTPPTATIGAPSATQATDGNTGTVSYAITYADANFASSNLTAAGITLNTTGTANATIAVTGSGTSYTVTLSNFTGSGTLGITLGAGYAADYAGNTDPGAGASATFNVVSNDATLSNLAISNGTLSPAFNSTVTGYSATVGNGLANINITPTVHDPNATVTINGTTATSGSATAVPLVVGTNKISITVTAQDGSTQQFYRLTVTEVQSANANLASIKTSAGLAQGATVPTMLTETVVNAVTSLTVTPVAANAGSNITVNNIPVGGSNPSSAIIALNQGANTITIVVTAANGAAKTYTLTVTRAPEANNKLSGLLVSNGTLSPAFGTATNYNDYVGYGAKLTVTPTTADPAAMLTINGVNATSGMATAVPLIAGNNTITIVVTAQNGGTKTYTVIVNEARSLDNSLFSLKTSGGLAQGKTVPASLTENVGQGVSSIMVTPTLDDTTARVTVNNVAVASGTPSAPIGLAPGGNTITIVVTAQNQTTKTYTLTVQRGPARPIANNLNETVSVEKPIEQIQLENDGVNVHQGLSPNGDGINDFLQIDNISQYPDNKLSIINRNGQLVFEAKGYDNATKTFDGHSNKNGQMQLPGTYFYSLDYTVKGIVKHKTGFLVLKY